MDAYIGEIIMFAGSFAIQESALCNGNLIAIQQNSALFSILGVTYGGNGTTTFGLPNLQGRAMMNAGQLAGGKFYKLGEVGGTAEVKLNINQIPSHSHAVKSTVFTAGAATTASAIGTAPGSTTNVNLYSDTFAGTDAMTPMQIPVGSVTASTGGEGAHENMQPYLTVNILICTSGVFPPRP